MWPSEHSEASTAVDPSVAHHPGGARAPETESEYHDDSNIHPEEERERSNEEFLSSEDAAVQAPTVHLPLFGPVPLLNQKP